ncbi:tetratricopeptide repeat protein [Ereboglobus luteus]|nr:tetratricopeptide repeat protein [Ereboglobus luteus]
MSNHPPHAHNPKKPVDETPRAPTSDEQLKSFWLKNEKSIYIVCFVIILAVAGVGVFRNMQKESADKVGLEYAAAKSTDQLRAFITAHPGHPLATAAELRIADEDYQAKNYSSAAAAYDKVAAAKSPIFSGRALIGAAMSKVLGGEVPDGEARLKQISNDTIQTPIIRGEATYHLATLAADAGRTAEAISLYKQVADIAPDTVWAENASYQGERLSGGANTAAASSPSVQFQ